MANEPSLSEFTNISTEADRGGGNPSILIDTKDTAKGLQQAAIAKQRNDFDKYNLFLSNLKDIYKDASNIQGMEVMTQDRPELMDKMGKVFQEIADDPKGTLGGSKLADIQAKLGKLKFDATESQKNNLFDKANREYLARNPDLNVPENKDKFEQFGNQKLGTRKPFTLDIPPVFDPYTLAKLANDTVKKDFADVNEVKNKSGDFFEKTSGTKYDKDQYKKVVDQAYDANTKLQQGVHRSFSGLPKDEQEAWEKAGGEKAWYSNFMQNLRSQDQTKKEDIKANEFALEALKNRDKVSLEYVKQNLKDKDKKEQAKFLYDTYHSLTNNTTGKSIVVDLGKTESGKVVYSESEEEINASPEILKLFSGKGKSSIKESGGVGGKETETISEGETPGALTKTKDGGIRVIYYQHYTEDDPQVKNKSKRVGDVVTDRDGHAIQESVYTVSKKEAAAIIGKDFIDKKDLPQALEVFNEASDYDDAQKNNQPKTYNLGGKTFTESQLEKGAKKYKMTVEQYKASIGL